MKTIQLCIAMAVMAGTAWGAAAQHGATPYWQATYKGAGQLVVQSGALAQVSPLFDAASNFVQWSFAAVPTNIPVFGTTDAGYAVIWVLNGDAKGSLTIKPVSAQHPAAQYFFVICSNSHMKSISVKLDAGSVFGTGVPLAGPTWSPFASSASQFGMVICDGDAETMSFNCDLYGTLLYAKSIKTLRLKNTYLSCVLTGTPSRRDTVVAGTVTNDNVLIFSGGSIGSIVAKRITATSITVGAPLLNGYMDEMPGVYTLNPPGGPIGSLTAEELRGAGSYEDGRWETSSRYIPNLNTMILSTGVGRLHVKRIITQNTSVYIHD